MVEYPRILLYTGLKWTSKGFRARMAWTVIEAKNDFGQIIEAVRLSGDQVITDGEETYVLSRVAKSDGKNLREILRRGGPLAEDENLGSG